MSTDDEFGGVDISQYQTLLGYNLESADLHKGEPQGKNHVSSGPPNYETNIIIIIIQNLMYLRIKMNLKRC